MFYVVLSKLREWFSSRILLVAVFYIALAGIMIFKLYQIQILEAKQVTEAQDFKLVRERSTKSTRGLIYDCNNRLLAYNELSYSVILEDSPLLNTNDKKNAMLYHLITLLRKEDVALEPEFYIAPDEGGILQYTVEGTARLRFIKNALGKKSIEKLTEEEREMSAEELFLLLRHGNDAFGAMYGISDEYSLEDALQIMAIRYAIFTLWPKYSQILIASELSDTMIAALRENSTELPGISIDLQTRRVYNYSEYFAHIIGYTGRITEEELEFYNTDDKEVYTATDVIGKTGLEKTFEDLLNGEKGLEQLTLDENYRIVETKVIKEPEAGNNLYLTIDAEQQKAYYYLVEKELAKILLKQMTDKLDYGTKGKSADDIKIPVYEVYNALFANNVFDVEAVFLTEPGEFASANQSNVYWKYQEKYERIMDKLADYLSYDSTVTPKQLSAEMAEYLDYIYSKITSAAAGFLPVSNIDKTDSVYSSYRDGNISLSAFLRYAITKNWLDLDKLGITEYYISDEIYEVLKTKALQLLKEDPAFVKMILRNMIFGTELSGKEICLLLFDQDIIDYKEEDYTALANGRRAAYGFIREKIEKTEITPAQLALEPCGASLVITDVNGDVKVCVTYPGYDNNKLANKIDWEYYQKLLADKSNPLSSRVTNSKTTTGSTFKMITSFAGYGENKLGLYETIDDLGEFTKVDPSPHCWYYPHKHGKVDVSRAILHSCNYFYFEVGYRLSLDSSGQYSDSLGISKLAKYAEMFGFGKTSGIEVAELEPLISTKDAVRTAIGYYHSFTPAQIARYVTTLANKGNCYDLTLIDSIKDKNNVLLQKNSATLLHKITEFTDAEWKQVQKGMYLVLNGSDSTGKKYNQLGFDAAGKSGTAQVSDTKPSHVLFVSYAPYENPEIAISVVIPNGYSSGYAVDFGYVVYDYYYHPQTYDVFYNKIEE